MLWWTHGLRELSHKVGAGNQEIRGGSVPLSGATERGAEGLTGARDAGTKGWLVLAEEEGLGG